jgi:RNA polymerase sigma-70 factor (ECF subfamily)
MAGVPDRFEESLLVLRCQTGDAAAFEELVARYQPRLRYFLRKMLREDRDLDDLVQEIWFDVLRGLARLADPGAFAAWLYQIARHRVVRELRKRRQPLRSLDEVDVPVGDCEESCFSTEDAEEVHAALDWLTPEHREVLLLRFVEGMTYEDIARVYDCPVGTVRSRLHYAKRALRQTIERINHHE